MREGTTSNGFQYRFEETNLDDMRFVDILVSVIDEKTGLLEKLKGTNDLLLLLLGKEQKEALYEHIGKAHNGRVPRAEVEKALEEIMGGSKEIKNSEA